MYLKSLEMQGFKSFPDKITLEFDKGLTAVVGPNGSGKSNIGDAMRWVLGEQSSKTLRGGKMEDVIFSGTQLRRAVGFAKVTLNIDNTDRALPEDGDVVAVSRKLYRTGESEYKINGRNVRLKDILEMFMDTGLGRDGYSIIGQGRIADIVSSKSGDRREIFEEAAGIAKFRYKKEESQRRLNAAEDNILRLNDIIGELESRLEPLRVQCEKARKFTELDAQKRTLEVSVWVAELERLRGVLTATEEKLLIAENEYEVLAREIETAEEQIQENLEQSAALTQQMEERRERIHEIELETSRSMADIAVLENDIKHIGENITAAKEQLRRSASSREYLTEETRKRRTEMEQIQAQRHDIGEKIAEAQVQLAKHGEDAAGADESLKAQTEHLNALYIEKSQIEFQTENAKNNISEYEDLLRSSEDFDAKLAESRQNSHAEQERLSALTEQLTQSVADKKNVLTGLEKLLSNKKAQRETSRTEFQQAEMKIRERSQKLGILNDLENSMEGFSRSVREIAKAQRQGRISGIHGTVAQLISVERAYSVAVETALGGALHNIIVENEDAAKRCIRFLKDTNAGRATFLPVTTVRGTALSINGLSACEGYVALGSQIVSADERFSGIITSLLGRICIAEDLDSATRIAKRFGYKFRIVTLDGQVINAGGSFTGGSVARSTGILTRKNEIEDLTAQIQTLTESRTEHRAKFTRLEQETAKLAADLEGTKEQLEADSRALFIAQTDFKRAQEIFAELDEKQASSETQKQTLEQKLIAETAAFEKNCTRAADIQQEIAAAEQEAARKQEALTGLHESRAALSEEISRMQIRLTALAKDEDACVLSIEQLRDAISSSEQNTAAQQKQVTEYEQEIVCKHERIDEIHHSAAGAKDRIAVINREISDLMQKQQALERVSGEQRTLLKGKNEEKEAASREAAKLTEKRGSFNEECDRILAALWEQYTLTRSEAMEAAQPIDDKAAADRQLTELKSKIRALGTVNLAAIEEYAEVSERYEFLSGQLKDVLKAKTELTGLIEDLTESMKQIFTENFNKINRSFQSVFVELFGGGKAELVLCDPENVLECGIDIKVAPPGKVINSLSLLSGGEQAFVAIAIYFAILKIHPSPFCLLDEIEAALDDVNVVKYAQYLRKFTDTTQFITITHRRGTMEEADVLYGVTMQEKGISRLLRMDAGEGARVVAAK